MRTVPQDARRDPVKMCGAGGDPEKAKGDTQQDLRILQKDQHLPEESYVVFIGEDWRKPFTQYLAEGVLPQKHSERYKLKRLATRYFLHNGVLFKKGYDGDPLHCLGLEETRNMIKDVHAGECGEHQGKKKLYRCLLQMAYYWPAMKKTRQNL
ncbi:uncharacterized protein LOC142634938 [Castanea sativa]|uniref:uncharacterized protein LOC142634938 n=1 Tax=Castanea sativa TaxID=21020 RepID=UPI003F649B85